MRWIYLSPHLDDVALSCGGLVWEQSQAGKHPQVWTICAGDPPPGPISPFAEQIHDRWQTGREAPAQRRAEDKASCRAMGATTRHLSIPDCIYRSSPETHTHLEFIRKLRRRSSLSRPGAGFDRLNRRLAGFSDEYLYTSDKGLFNPLHPDESPLLEQLVRQLQASLPKNTEIVCPLSLGKHVDHQLTRAAADRLGRSLWYYADYPYVLRENEGLDELRQAGWKAVKFPISEEGFSAWTKAVAAHTSQLSGFWPDLETMRAAMREYWAQVGGVRLWKE